ncbi:MAG TPA: formylglycine-generating enzyme family protein [Gammaproteobacteria bacterium]
MLSLALLGLAGQARANCDPAADQVRWQRVEAAGTVARLSEYLAACPQGRHVTEVRSRLRALERVPLPELVAVRGGCFEMGSAAGEPGRDADEHRHRVCVGDFRIGRFEVTFDEYDRFVAATGRDAPHDEGWGRGRQPVINVSWEEAVAYAEWLSDVSGRRFRLPTEAEWEYACTGGGKPLRFCGADQANPLGCYADNCRGRAHPVGGRPPNDLGIHDMSGNVGEWTCSAYDAAYAGGEQRCAKPSDARLRVGRGGSWLDSPDYLRTASRDGGYTAFRAVTLGFRLVEELPSVPPPRVIEAGKELPPERPPG